MDVTEPLFIALLIATGLAAGFINTIAAGGSNLTIPALMVLGMPADVANATNRVSVFMTAVSSIRGFHRQDRLPTHDLPGILLPTMAGGLIGAVLAAWLPVDTLKPLLLLTMISMTILMLVRPAVIAVPPGTEAHTVAQRPASGWMLLLAGIYGGFVQAGVGFVLLAVIAGSLRYDLVRANAVRQVCTLAFTVVSLAIFIANDLILWIPGLIVGASSMIGAHFAVRFAINASQRALRLFLLLMTVCASIAALLS